MAKIPVNLRVGKKLDEDSEKVISMLDDTYQDIAENLNQKSELIIRKNQDPTSDDFSPNIGTFWLNQNTPALWIMSNKTTSSATWTKIF